VLRLPGDGYWLDGNNCLNLKLTDLTGYPWDTEYPGFERNGMYLDDHGHWYDIWYEVTASGAPMEEDDCTEYWCPVPVRVSCRIQGKSLQLHISLFVYVFITQ
jgi:hypothetical protein